MSILDIIIFLPLVGAIAIALGAPARLTAQAAAAFNLLLGLVAWGLFNPGQEGFQLAASRPMVSVPEISYAVGIDGLSLVMLLLSVIVSFCAMWMAPKVDNRERLYFISLLLISAGALGAFCSIDVFFFYAFHELALTRSTRRSSVRPLAIFAATMGRAISKHAVSSSARRYCSRRKSTLPEVNPTTLAISFP